MTSAFFDHNPDLIYLDGNSLGRLPVTTAAAVQELIHGEWGSELIGAWEHWIDLPLVVGDQIAAHFLGAPKGSVVISDSTTVNFYKLAVAALDARPGRFTVITDRGNFPTDRYVLQGLAKQRDLNIRWLDDDPVTGPDTEQIARVMDDDTALVTLSHVAYRSAAIADMAAINRIAHAAGALTLWDLSHSVGAVPISLTQWQCDLAVGCTYKYLNGGPGSPAFLFVRPSLQEELRQPVWGWFGQTNQFAMPTDYCPSTGIRKFTAGTPPIIAITAIAAGVRALSVPGIEWLREQSMLLTDLIVSEFDNRLGARGFGLGSPREATRRGGHVLLTHPEAARVSQAMRRYARVVGDFREPDGIRLAPVPAYVTRDQVETAIERITVMMDDGRHREEVDTNARVV